MKKKAWIVACLLALASAAGFARTPSETPVNIAAILSQPAFSGACPSPQSEVLFAAARIGTGLEKATCEAHCGTDPAVSCSGTTCTGADRSCPGERGHVSCTTNNVTTTVNCLSPCPISGNCQTCNDTGDCFACCRCDGGTLRQCSEACNGGF
ncbi:MAG TPA: hypothetical protein VE685_13460 [Thermoanaerobaculia bacterium]|nr:hypothetical protein [Thermoanaerobaculia bacterium]